MPASQDAGQQVFITARSFAIYFVQAPNSLTRHNNSETVPITEASCFGAAVFVMLRTNPGSLAY